MIPALPQASDHLLYIAAWRALADGDWRAALEIIPFIDAQLTDLKYYELVCSTYVQAEEWEQLGLVASVAAKIFPTHPAFKELSAQGDSAFNKPLPQLWKSRPTDAQLSAPIVSKLLHYFVGAKSY